MTDDRDPSPELTTQPGSAGSEAGAAASSGAAWDPWAPPRPEPAAPESPSPAPAPSHAGAPAVPAPPADPSAPTDPSIPADPSTPAEHTQPVDLSHTQPVDVPRPDPTAPVWVGEPTGWPSHHGGPADQGSPADGPKPGPAPHDTPAGPAATSQPVGHGPGWDPFSGPSADAGYTGRPPGWVGGQPVAQGTAPQQKGPGWGALVAVSAVMSLVAAVLGGMFGGWLGATDRVDFERLDRAPTSIPSAGRGATARPEGSIANIAAKALPSVVTIKVRGADGAGTGSGFVLDRDGHIITNNHVIAGAADTGTIKVELSDGTEIDATIQGRDGSYDLAVLKTRRTDLPPLTMGRSADVVVGDQVIAVGAPLGLESTVTSGIVSALDRPVSPGGDGDQQSYINAIQTDAAINPGNSGGPLLNMQGEVVGVNTAIARIPGATDSQSGNIGVGFSIPSDQVLKTAEQLIRTGKAQHPIIGVVLDRQYEGEGVKILSSASSDSGAPVSPDGPADKAGIKPGDVIVEFDGRKVSDPDDLVVAIRSKNVGERVPMKVRRGSETISVTLTLAGTSG